MAAADSSPEPTQLARVTVVSRPGCHLCSDAMAVIEPIAAELGIQVRELNLDSDLDERSRLEYAEQIPVVLIDGEFHACYRVDPERFRLALAGQKRWWRRR